MSEPLDDFFDPVDDAEWRPAREIFARLGYVPLPPGEVDDFQLRGRLWEFIHALAGRRFFLHHTNHLSDRELYTWLHDRWFPEETADCPPEAETNCHIDLTEALADDGETFLRYYASEADRLVWADADPAQPLPPHEDPPFDRDRFLPDPWRPFEAGTPATEALDEDDEERAEDPLGLAAVDAALAEAERERQAERDAAEAEATGEARWERPLARLRQEGVHPLPPAELTDETVPAKLWELLHELGRRGWQVDHTDHLSDRQLYELLWTVALREPALLPRDPVRGGVWMQDLLTQAGDQASILWLRHYADEDARSAYARSHPGTSLPEPAPRPYSRDWRLPR